MVHYHSSHGKISLTDLSGSDRSFSSLKSFSSAQVLSSSNFCLIQLSKTSSNKGTAFLWLCGLLHALRFGLLEKSHGRTSIVVAWKKTSIWICFYSGAAVAGNLPFTV